MGEAEARRDAGMAEAKAEMERMEAKLYNDTEIARARRDFDLKKAEYDVEVNTAKAEAEKAFELQVLKLYGESRALAKGGVILFRKYLSMFPLLTFLNLGRNSATKNQRTTDAN